MAKFGMMIVFFFFLTILPLIIVLERNVYGQEEIPQQDSLGISFITDEEAIRTELESIGVNVDELKNNVQPVSEQEEVLQQDPLGITFITDEEAIRTELESIGVDFDNLKDSIHHEDSNDGGSAPQGVGGHAGFFYCPGPNTARHLFQTSAGPYIVTFLGSHIWIDADTCTSPFCLVLAITPIPSGDFAASYGVAAPFTTNFGAWCDSS